MSVKASRRLSETEKEGFDSLRAHLLFDKNTAVVAVILVFLVGAMLLIILNQFGAVKTPFPPALATAGPIVTSPTQPYVGASPSTSSQNPNSYEYVFYTLDARKAERICVDLARQFAGDGAWGVFGCSCSESASSDRKDYSCVINTIQGGKPANALCIRAEGRCLMSAEGYLREITFQEIAEKYG